MLTVVKHIGKLKRLSWKSSRVVEAVRIKSYWKCVDLYVRSNLDRPTWQRALHANGNVCSV